MHPVTNVFKALSDPVRVDMIQRLIKGSNFNLSTISIDLGMTRQGARKHLVILEKAEIIHLQKKGRSTQVQLNKASLTLVKDFITKLEHQWDQRLLALKNFVEEK